MTMLYIDSFDHMQTSDLVRKGWSSNNAVIQDSVVRTGVNALLISSSAKWSKLLVPGSPQTVIIGFAIRLTNLNNTDIEWLGNGSVLNVNLRFNSDGSIRAFNGDSAAGVITINTWYYIEVKVKIDNSAGAVEVYVNGVQVIDVTGVDNQASTNAVTENIYFRGAIGTLEYIDDIYLCDVAGAVNNDFLGPGSVTAFLPDGAGTNTDFTPSAGANFENVDDNPSDDDTTYNESTGIGDKDDYSFASVVALKGNILGVQLTSCARNADVGSVNMKNFVRSGGTPAEVEIGNLALINTYAMLSTIWEEEPTDSVSWDTTKIDAATFGVKHES